MIPSLDIPRPPLGRLLAQHVNTMQSQGFIKYHLYLCLTRFLKSQSFAAGVKGRDYEISFLEEEFSLFEKN